MKKRMVLLDVYNNEVRDVEIDDLQDMYKAIDCSCIEIPVRTIGGKKYNIICDEEGTFRSDAKISAIDNLGNIMFVGNLLITSAYVIEDGELTGLTEEEASEVKKYIRTVSTRKYPEGYKMLTHVEY